MFKYKNCFYKLNNVDLTKHTNLLITRNFNVKPQNQLLRFRSNIATIINEPDEIKSSISSEWQSAKPFEEIPTMSQFTLIRNFLPGGKYYKLDVTEFLMALREDLGGFCKIPGSFGQTDIVFTHNVQDFETLLRNEGIWPKRVGLEALNYHRSVYRADYFQGTEGLLATHGEKWGSFRSTVNPVLMQPKNVRLYLGKMSQVNKEFIERYKATVRVLKTDHQDRTSSFTREWQSAKPYEEISSINKLTLLKNVLPGGKYSKFDSVQFIFALKRDLGSSIYKLPGLFGQPDLIFTHNVQDFETIFRNEDVWPKRPGLLTLNYHRRIHRPTFFQGVLGLLTSHGKKLCTLKSVINPVLMKSKTIRLYLGKMSQVNKEFIERIRQIRDPKTLEMPATFEEEINRWTLESVSVVALDKQLGLINKNRNNPMAAKMFATLNEFIALSLDVELKPSIWRYYKTKTFKKLMNSLDTLLEITTTYINEAIERLEQERLSGVREKAEHEKSVLEKLLKIDKKIATVMAMDIFMAGVDTSSSTFTGLLLCLAKNPEKQAKLREEVRQILPNKDSEFTEEACKNMPYLRACIKEALRVYPLTVGNARSPANDVVLSGYRIPKDTRVSMVSIALLRDEKHFPRANEYLPERWLRIQKENDENQSTTTTHPLRPSCPFVYLPFGFGPRTCIGRRIVEMELELGIARIVRNFQVEFNHPTENAFKSVLMNVPNIPLKFKFTDIDE